MSRRSREVLLAPDVFIFQRLPVRRDGRCLADKRRLIHVCPQSIPLSVEQLSALAEGRLLFIFPQPGVTYIPEKATLCFIKILNYVSIR